MRLSVKGFDPYAEPCKGLLSDNPAREIARDFCVQGCAVRTNFPTNNIGRQINYEAVKAQAFADQGILVAAINDTRLDDFERQFLKNIGNKLFGVPHG